MLEVIFLFALALIWMVFASIQDLKTREVSDWLNFSLIIFALGFRFFYCLFSEPVNFDFLYQGFLGFGIGFVLANLFYYGRVFAGGDAKLLWALGAILPIYDSYLMNIKLFLFFIILFMIVGTFYGLCWSFYLAFQNRRKFKVEFTRVVKAHHLLIYTSLVCSVILLIGGFFADFLFAYIAVFLFLPFLYLYAKSIENIGMTRFVDSEKLTEGDWLVEDVEVGSKTIKATWEGLTKADIEILQKKKKKVLIKEGIPFVPVFLISFVIFVVLYFLEYLNFLYYF